MKRFNETFEKVNIGLSKHFPRLFEGGKAYLEREKDNALDGGGFVKARPPGKRNSNIHLLSGGEKALTAVALLFSIFELNPEKASLIINPSSAAPGFIVKNVFCLPGVPSILKSMLGGLNNILVGGDPVLSKTLNLRTVESEIAKSLTEVQNKNNEVEIGSYPFFRAGKLGVSIVLRSTNQKKIDLCNEQILEFVKIKNIEILRDN